MLISRSFSSTPGTSSRSSRLLSSSYMSAAGRNCVLPRPHVPKPKTSSNISSMNRSIRSWSTENSRNGSQRSIAVRVRFVMIHSPLCVIKVDPTTMMRWGCRWLQKLSPALLRRSNRIYLLCFQLLTKNIRANDYAVQRGADPLLK